MKRRSINYDLCRSGERNEFVRYHVIMACYNRRAATIAALHALRASAEAASVNLTLTVYDDASEDGTAEAVLKDWPCCRLLTGTGRDFWAKSMAGAERSVLDDPCVNDRDFIVWLNDDVILDCDAFSRIAIAAEQAFGSILVGAMRDPASQDVTYSGLVRSGIHPLSFTRCQPDRLNRKRVSTFNGNFVLVPVQSARLIGGIDGQFSHALADIDYGYRAGRVGVCSYVAPGIYGQCARNPPSLPGSIVSEWIQFTGPKGAGNLQSMTRILRRLAPLSWPLYILTTYVLWFIRIALRSRLAGR